MITGLIGRELEADVSLPGFDQCGMAAMMAWPQFCTVETGRPSLSIFILSHQRSSSGDRELQRARLHVAPG